MLPPAKGSAAVPSSTPRSAEAVSSQLELAEAEAVAAMARLSSVLASRSRSPQRLARASAEAAAALAFLSTMAAARAAALARR